MSNVKNVEALARLVGLCTGLGGRYNPGQQNLQVASMQTLLSNAQEVLLKVSTTKTKHENATDNRELLYEEIRELVRRIIAELKSSGATSLSIANAQTMARKINGSRYKADPDSIPEPGQPNAEVPAKRRARGRDYASVAHHFEKLLETLSAELSYEPSAEQLQVSSLRQMLASMYQANDEVIQAYVAWNSARAERDELFYGKNGSLFTTGRKVKHKVKAVFGFSSKAYQDVREVRFTKPQI
jgi:hypothetical protein